MWKIRVTLPSNYDEIKTIYLACRAGQFEDVQDFLNAHPALLEKPDAFDNTPLQYASKCGHAGTREEIILLIFSDIVEYLCLKGAKDDAFGRCYINALVTNIFFITLFLRINIFVPFYANSMFMEKMYHPPWTMVAAPIYPCPNHSHKCINK